MALVPLCMPASHNHEVNCHGAKPDLMLPSSGVHNSVKTHRRDFKVCKHLDTLYLMSEQIMSLHLTIF